MAKIYGELEKAQLENLNANPASNPAGLVYYNTVTGKPRYYDNVSASWVEIGAATPSSNNPDQIDNVGLAISVGSSAATIALKQKDGSTDATALSPAIIGFRHGTITTGGFNVRQVTAALSIVIPSTATMGFNNATRKRLYVYGIDNAGTVELAVSGTNYKHLENELISTIAISTSSDDDKVIYSTTARTDVPIKLLGHFDSEQATAGTWASTADQIFIGDKDDGYISNYKYLDKLAIPSTTNAYGWHNNGSSDFDGSNWVGGVTATEHGSIAAATNHLGQTTYCDFDGSADYVTAAIGSTHTGSITLYSWFKSSAADNSNYKTIMGLGSDFGGTGRQAWIYSRNGYLRFEIYPPSFSQVGLLVPHSTYFDGQFHLVALVYNASSLTMTVIIDGKIVAHTYNATLTSLSSITANLSVAGATSGGYLLAGQFAEYGFFKYAATFEEIRKMYVTGTKKKGYIDENSKVLITGEQGNLGEYTIVVPNQTGLTNTSYAAVSGWELYLPEDGYYRLYANAAQYDLIGSGYSTALQIYNDTTSTIISGLSYDVQISQSGISYINPGGLSYTSKEFYAPKNTRIILRGNVSSGGTYQLQYCTFGYDFVRK